MRRLIGLAALLFAGMLAWQVGNRLSTDAVGMGVGLVFGVLAGVPAALLVLATGRRQRDDDDDSCAYEDGYRHGMRDTTSLAMGTRPQPIDDGRFSAEWMERMMAQRNAPAVIVVQQPAPKFTHARPFAIVPATAPLAAPTRCANWQRCPDCGLPLTPDEHCAEWCGVQP